jgi:hypothetical protein
MTSTVEDNEDSETSEDDLVMKSIMESYTTSLKQLQELEQDDDDEEDDEDEYIPSPPPLDDIPDREFKLNEDVLLEEPSSPQVEQTIPRTTKIRWTDTVDVMFEGM